MAEILNHFVYYLLQNDSCEYFSRFLTLGILFSTAVNTVFVAKLLTLGIFFSNSVSFAFLTKSVHWEFSFQILFFQCGT